MNKISVLFLVAAASLMVCGCSTVVSKKPVGEKIADLSPKTWNARWVAGNGTGFSTRIKDAKLGLVEIYQITTDDRKNKPPKSVDLYMRNVGDKVVVNSKDTSGKEEKTFSFGRVVVTREYLVVFAPDAEVFGRLIKRKLIPGTLLKDEHGKLSGSSEIEEFTDATWKKVEASGQKFDGLFQGDPFLVLVRKSPQVK